MSYPVLSKIEARFRDKSREELAAQFTSDLHFPLWVHCLQAFGYREDWAEPLLAHARFDPQGRPYFPRHPETPEAHRHKFLCALTFAKNSPRSWKIEGKNCAAEDFVAPILEGPLENWGDGSLYPDPSWTFQFLSAFLNEAGAWRGQDTSLPGALQEGFAKYFADFESGDLFAEGKTLYVESGLHCLEAINKLIRCQGEMVADSATKTKLRDLFPLFKMHLGARLKEATEHTVALLTQPDWIEREYRSQAAAFAISRLLVLGHLMEVCFHPAGELQARWNDEEKIQLKAAGEILAGLMDLFFDPRVLALLDEQQTKAYSFPLFHAYHALRLSEDME